jgi:beta-glucosidase
VQGFQGEDLSATNTILACAKHFAGYAFAEAGRDYNTVDVSESTLQNIIFPPFKAAADEENFMNSFNELNGVPATGSAYLQRKILKEDWKFVSLFLIGDQQ